MRDSQLNLFQSFTQKQQQRSKVAIGGEVEAIFDYCEYVIHTEYDKRSKSKYKFKERKKEVSEDFMRAYDTLDREDKIMYYIKNVIYLLRISTGNMKAPKIHSDAMETTAYTLSYNLKRWKQKNIRLDNNRQIIFGQRSNTIKQYDLGDYIFRGSKNSKYYAFVLQAIKQTVYKEMKTVHFGFDNAEEMKKWAEAVQLCIDYRHWQRIYIEMYKKQPPRASLEVATPLNRNLGERQSNKIYTESFQPNKQNKIQQEQKIALSMPNKPIKQMEESFEQFESGSDEPQGNSPQLHKERTIIQELVQGEISGGDHIQNIQNRNVQEVSNQNIKNLNIFHKMFPQFEFNEVEWQGNFEMIHNDGIIRIMQHANQKQKYKIVMELNSSVSSQLVFKALSGPDFLASYNQNVEEAQVKTYISSENAAIIYLTLKQFNRIYRPRDFLFIRHCFSIGPNALYIADKDVQNSNYPPFLTIVRGKYECVWAILKKDSSTIKVIGNAMIDNSGYLNDNQNTNLTLNYLKNYSKLAAYIGLNQFRLQQFEMFDLKWDITKNDQNKKEDQLRVKRNTQKIQAIKVISPEPQKSSLMTQKVQAKKEELKVEQSKVQVKDITLSPTTKFVQKQKQLDLQREKMNLEQVQAEIDIKQAQNTRFQTQKDIKLNFDKDGMVIVSKGFTKTKYQLTPTKNYPSLYWQSPIPGTHPLWTNDWKHDTKKGGMLFINAKKIQDQKGVLKFILSKIGKNLISGKSILNISLPVDIFVGKSNLELFIQSLCYAPIMLEKGVTMDPMQKFKKAAAFGISMSPLYLIMEKPFNPILGETFQAWINGCPAYAQQVSHHPPICSLLLLGRGYTISGQFQSKAEVHMNSGTGTNDGIFRINFDDGTKICFCSPGGEVSGLTYGDRKFNSQGKAYCWSQTQNYFVEIVFNPTKKGFFSMKKQEQPEDYFEGDVLKVTGDFIQSLEKKRRTPTQKQILDTMGQIKGVWHQQLLYDSQVLLDIGKQLPYKLQYQKNPLPSDSNWRQDIAYRRLLQVQRAQTEKERLQVLQRNDRKLRQKKK